MNEPTLLEEIELELRNPGDHSQTALAALGELKTNMGSLNKLLEHILAMADDAYLVGHPEWHEIVDEAKKIKETNGK